MLRIKHFIMQSWLLIVASFFFGLLIAVTSTALSPRIKANEERKLSDLMKSLIADANSFELAVKEIEVAGRKGKILKTDIYRAADAADETVGFAFIAEGAGFADKIRLVIALDKSGETFFGYKVLASNETPGFGDKIKEAFYGEQFVGAGAGEIIVAKIGNPKQIDSTVVAISGATVSSEAVVKIFNTYTETIKQQLKAKGLIN